MQTINASARLSARLFFLQNNTSKWPGTTILQLFTTILFHFYFIFKQSFSFRNKLPPQESRAFYVNSSTLKNLNELNIHGKTWLKNTNTTFDFKDLWYNCRPEINLLFRFITVDEHWPVNNYWSRPVLTNIPGIVPVVGWNSNQCQPYIRGP